jgi:hypothetical protein
MPDRLSGAPSTDPNSATGFPGFGEGAPLELSGLSPLAEAGLGDRIRDRSFGAWADTAAAVGYCSQPVRLTGSSTTFDATTGEVVDTFSSRQTPLGCCTGRAGTGGRTSARPAPGSTRGTSTR